MRLLPEDSSSRNHLLDVSIVEDWGNAIVGTERVYNKDGNVNGLAIISTYISDVRIKVRMGGKDMNAWLHLHVISIDAVMPIYPHESVYTL